MTKADFINAVSDKTGFTKKDSDKAVNAVIEVIKDALVAGDKVSLVGFGSFEVKERAARQGHNPQTGAPITIAASKHPAFKAGKGFKELVNGKK